MMWFRPLLPIAVTFALAACDSGPTEPRTPGLPRPLTHGELAVLQASNTFAFSLLRELHSETPDENLFISPLSASMALGMTMNGADGITYDEMRDMLGFGGLSEEEINASYRGLVDLLRGLDRDVDFRIANSIWYRQGFPFKQPFMDRVRTHFDAEVRGLDFGSPASAGIINDWVKQATNGRIDEIIERINPLDVMFLINAIYFKGAWTHQFEKSRTQDDLFTGADGSQHAVKMMRRHAQVPAFQDSELSAVELPYGRGDFSMVVVVPRTVDGLGELVQRLDVAGWQTLLASMAEMTGEIHLPRFRLEWESALNEPLERLGMTSAFVPFVANFSRMADVADLHVSDVFQKTFVEVNEEGTEAAAVTKVTVGVTSVPAPLLRADRPFLFAIRERESGTIIFIGAMALPAP